MGGVSPLPSSQDRAARLDVCPSGGHGGAALASRCGPAIPQSMECEYVPRWEMSQPGA